MEQFQQCFTLTTKKFFVMAWDTLILLLNLYIIYTDIRFMFGYGILTLMNLLSLALSTMWIVHYMYNCGTQYSEKYEWVIYLKFVYLINMLPNFYYILLGYPVPILGIVLFILMYLISFGLEYIYLIHLKKSKEQENANNAPTPSQGNIQTTPNYTTPIIPPEQPQTQQVYYGQTVYYVQVQSNQPIQQNDQYCPPTSGNDNYQQYSKPHPAINNINNSNQ